MGRLSLWPPLLDRSLLHKTGFVSVHYYLPNIISPIRRVCWSRSHNNSLRPRQNGRLFADDTFKRIFLNENIRISTKNSLKFVPKGLINNIPTSVLIMAWRRPGDKPLSEPMLVRSLTHICVTRPQWVYQSRERLNKLSSHTLFLYKDSKLRYDYILYPFYHPNNEKPLTIRTRLQT